jgi:cell wall-active antibiotic response 4TMS protein YvqF
MSTNANVVGYCRACGIPLDETSVRKAQGTIFCAEHVPATSVMAPPADPASPYTAPPYHAATVPPPLPGDSSASPGLAFGLGLIPGVGAIYNGQYAKGLVHVLLLGFIISILSTGSAGGLEPLFGILIPCLVFYMAFEAFHTAKKRRDGQIVDEFSGFLARRNGHSRFPAGPVVLIALGVLFLLNNLEILEFRRILRYWPALLIVGGLYMLFERVTAHREERREEQR